MLPKTPKSEVLLPIDVAVRLLGVLRRTAPHGIKEREHLLTAIDVIASQLPPSAARW
jgi:hypothetical protein